MEIVAFVAFFALVVAWLAAPNGERESATAGMTVTAEAAA